MIKLTGKQARHLRALGHHLQPVVMIGKNELDPRVIEELDKQLSAHELVKIRILDSCLTDRRELAPMLAAATGAGVAQIVGRTLLLYRPAETPVIKLP